MLALCAIGGRVLPLFSFLAPNFFLNLEIVALSVELIGMLGSRVEELGLG